MLAYMWITMAVIAINIANPAPYDAMILLASFMLPVVGMVRYSRGLGAYFLVWMGIVAGGYLATTQAGIYNVPTNHTTITLFLAFTSVMLTGFIACDPDRYVPFLLSGYLLSAVIAATAALAGFFHLLPGAYDLFTRYGRARGTFQDPNVYSAFLVPAILYCFNLVLTRPLRRALPYVAILGLLLFAILFALSRGAWINLALGLLVFSFFTFGRAPSNRYRIKLLFFVMVAVVLAIGALAVARTVPTFSNLFQQRATLEQAYDKGPEGRFDGQIKAAKLIATHPLGIGALEFARVYYNEDVHETYLSTFLQTGWLGGFLYIGMVLTTIVLGLRQTLADSGGNGLSAVVTAAFIGMAFEGVVIDTEHWRHFYVLMALIWGISLGDWGGYRQSLRRAGSGAHGYRDAPVTSEA